MSTLTAEISSNTGNNKTLEYIIGKAFEEAERTCTSPSVLSYSRNLPGVPIKFHTLITILSAVACIFNCSCAMYLTTGHVVNWVRPAEQRYFIRIILFDVVFSLTSFFSIYFYSSASYNHAFGTYYEAFAMLSLFLLYNQFICPEPGDRAQYFSNLQRLWMNGKIKKNSSGSLRWFHGIWICVFQIAITRVASFVAQTVVEATMCPLSKTKSNISIAIQVIQSCSTFLTVWGVIVFERRMHKRMVHHGQRPLLKLVSFKLVVGLEALQDVLFSSLASTGTYFPQEPYYVSWQDFDLGIPSLILTWEMTIISILFLWSFNFEPYRQLALDGEKIQASSFQAFFQAFDFSDVYRGVRYMLVCLTQSTYMEGRVDGRKVEGLPGSEVSDGDEMNSFENKMPLMRAA